MAWKAGCWTFAVYSHYDRGHFYNAHPKVFVTYRGGNNHKHDRFYADRHVNKPAPAVHHDTPKTAHFDKPAVHNNKPAVHNNAVRHDNGHSNANRHIAQATNNRNGSGHFSGRR